MFFFFLSFKKEGSPPNVTRRLLLCYANVILVLELQSLQFGKYANIKMYSQGPFVTQFQQVFMTNKEQNDSATTWLPTQECRSRSMQINVDLRNSE